MSMFRRPGDSSSSSEASESEYEEASESQQDTVLSRINTLDSNASGPTTQPQRPSHLQIRQNSTQSVRDLLLHSLLEERTIKQVAEQLGKDPSDPEAQRLGRASYKEIARQISNNVDDLYASDDMQGHRTTANEGINRLTRSNLSKLSVIPEGSALALITRPGNTLDQPLPQQPSLGLDLASGIAAPIELELRGYPHLQTDRYVREFSELEVVGKGGYGKVFKAKHKLDGSFYAVKRIPVSPSKVAKIQEHGPEELESMLEEVRSLARFDHNNIVRYHNAWLEFTTITSGSTTTPEITMLGDDRLLEEAAAFPSFSDHLPSRLDNLTFDDPFERTDNSHGADIVFESSQPCMDAGEPEREAPEPSSFKETLRQTRRGNRRDSQASQTTVATVSSTKSRMSAVEDVDEDEEDKDVENIPRSHMPYSQERVSEMSDSMVSNSDVPRHLVQNRSIGPVLTLNVQMSLCETNLAAFLSSERAISDGQTIGQHCFHPCVSLELLNNIVSGVEYLHAQDVVHRDLKPANVFLSLSRARNPPYGSVDMSSCKPCSKQDCLHITPRIGDFGLVAVLSDSYAVPDTTKPVGTEFYRPQTSSGISEKLDVFALGVVAFEMLQRFGTRMERIAALTQLRRGTFPEDFAQSFGDMGSDVQQLISDMIQEDERSRLSCDHVKAKIRDLVHTWKT
ncbi:eukaryotic translation initiation factor 2-alpha kinase 2 [Decorospora gaudefroyi]|uniref:Eukaryotic translation initiation factor 2-alpha kinase 2 n=1 Tax=Decorospora gaudefroyi TaxID=184978 RepID=A0A6A5K3S2_9PLEO|nr:eukaryotic translation initiation factor 2-alpha kinase 2 [Decorospora gaudefroyi]